MCSIAQPVMEEIPLGLPLKRKRRRKKDKSKDDYHDGATVHDNPATDCGSISLEGNNEPEAVNMTVSRKKGTRKKKRQETTVNIGANCNPVNFLSGTESAVPESAEIQSLPIVSLSDMKQNVVEQTVIEILVPTSSHPIKKRKRKKPKNSVPLDENTCLEGSTGDKTDMEETTTPHSVNRETSRGHDDATEGANPAADSGNTSLTIASSHLKTKRKKPKNSVPLDENTCLEGSTGDRKNMGETTPHVNREISKGLDDATVGANPATDCGNNSVPIASLCDMEQTVAETPVPASSNPKKKRKKPKNSVPLDDNTCLDGSTGDRKNVGETTMPHVNREISKGHDDATVGDNPATDCGNTSLPIASLFGMEQNAVEQTVVEQTIVEQTAVEQTIVEQTAVETPVPASSHPKKKRKKPKNSVPLDDNTCVEGSTGDKKNVRETMASPIVNREMSKRLDVATDCGNTSLRKSTCLEENKEPQKDVAEMTIPRKKLPKRSCKKLNATDANSNPIHILSATESASPETAAIKSPLIASSCVMEQNIVGQNVVEIAVPALSHQKKKKKRKSEVAKDFVPLNENTCLEGKMIGRENSPETILPQALSFPLTKVVGSPRRKLLVLDLNGLLADFVYPQPKDVKADFQLKGKAVFRRPYCDYFLDFCFERFDVGIWSSRTRVNLDRAVDFLLGQRRRKLVFCWCQEQCTPTGRQTMDDKRKPLVLKELGKLWEWKKGVYDKSNTMLLDDSPYKALLNPPYTAIFPHPYSYMERRVDRMLGPEGFLRDYLEKLASSGDDVQTFVKGNRYEHGQMPITESHSDWPFYSKILKYLSHETDEA